MKHNSEVIALDSSSEEENDTPLIDLDDWNPRNPPEPQPAVASAPDPELQFTKCLSSILECFPDIAHEHVRKLYDEFLGSAEWEQVGDATEALISKILDRKTYPKEKDHLNELKRKRSDGEVDDRAEVLKWKTNIPEVGAVAYQKISRTALQESFPTVPLRHIDSKFREHGHLYAAYLDIADTERRYAQLNPPPYTKLKARRLVNGPNHDNLLRRIRAKEGSKGEKLELEVQAALEKRLRDDDAFEIEERKRAMIIAHEQDQRDRGEVLECGCCFDTIPMSKITQCNAEVAHFFCFDCARSNAENDIGLNRFSLSCMDGSGCRATFGRTERLRFLDERILAKLDSLEQQDSIKGALSDFFDFVTCPFCEYGHICPPVEEDKEFRCGFPDCREVSCRLCKERTHVPMTCAEYKREQGISERHIIEEARTEALLRSCPKCKIRILKDDGCNKVVCTTCRSAICDYCGKDITKEQYAHFDGQPGQVPAANSSGKCPLYDQASDRKEKQIGAAEKQAKENVRHEKPEITEDDLEIRFSDEVNKDSSGASHARYPYGRAHVFPVPDVPQIPGNLQRPLPAPRYQAPGADFAQRLAELRRNLNPEPHAVPDQPRPPIRAPEPQIPRPERGPQVVPIRGAIANERPIPQLDELNMRVLHLQQLQQLERLEQAAALRGQHMRERQQARLAALQEQQVQIANQWEGRADAFRQVLPGFALPPQPQIGAPVLHPHREQFDMVRQWLPLVDNAHLQPIFQNNNLNQEVDQQNGAARARRHGRRGL